MKKIWLFIKAKYNYSLLKKSMITKHDDKEFKL